MCAERPDGSQKLKGIAVPLGPGCTQGSHRKPQNSLQEVPVRTRLRGWGGPSLRVPSVPGGI